MNTYTAARSRYIDDAVSTASPATLLLMMYDRLLRDLERAESALRAGQRDQANTQLTHAQRIVAELASTLDGSAWEGATRLLSLYTFLTTTLIEANVAGDPERVAACRGLVEPLHEAWRAAAAQVAESAPARALGELGVG
ncbi:MAG: flagellar export chaperone FliS [Actinomycetes bacterium]